MVKARGSGVELPGFRSWFRHELAEQSRRVISFFRSLVSSLCNGGNKHPYRLGL